MQIDWTFGNVLRKEYSKHVMKYVGGRKGGEIKGTHVVVERGCEGSNSKKGGFT